MVSSWSLFGSVVLIFSSDLELSIDVLYYVMFYVLCGLLNPGRVAAVSATANWDPNKTQQQKY